MAVGETLAPSGFKSKTLIAPPAVLLLAATALALSFASAGATAHAARQGLGTLPVGP